MPLPSDIHLDKMLEHPTVADAVADENLELKERIAYQPPACEVFRQPFTRLETDGQYHFEIDKEAKRQLDHIIGNTVQRVKGSDDIEDEAKENYRQPRNIGIVFSGGPAPGGHNVIAGLFDAAKRTNPRTKIFGFLMGPTASSTGTALN